MPSQTTRFKTGDGHILNTEIYGDPQGMPVVFFHGGPGSGYSDHDKRFFDPTIFRVLFFDQRGAGGSEPAGRLEANTTQHLIRDTIALMNHFEMGKALFFGGSWGATLALCVALAHPQRVLGLLLRGYFDGTRSSAAYFENGGPALYHPEAWEDLTALVPESAQDNVRDYYHRKILEADRKTARRFAEAYQRYGLRLAFLEENEARTAQLLEAGDVLAKARIQAHYSRNDFFLEDGYVLNHSQTLPHVPVRMVHGRYDMVCLPAAALALKKRIPQATLAIVPGGHSASCPAVEHQVRYELGAIRHLLDGGKS